MRRVLHTTVVVFLLLVGVALAQPLSQQVLQLLARTNTWTADQTFTNITITGTCTGCGGAGGGTVTSVALTAPTSEFDVAGSPIVGSGTLALTWDTQNANIVFAGPSSGGAATPAFRALVDDDVPDDITIADTDNVTWASVNKTGSSLADLATTSAGDLTSGTLALARLTDGGTAGVPLVAGGGGGDPTYAALNLASATAITGALAAANFPALTGDITTAAGSLVTDLSDTGVAAAVYGSATNIPQITIDAEGRITLAANVAIGTNALLDASRHSDTAADAATRGSVIYGNASNQWDELNVGAAGRFLRSDGTDVAWGTDGSALTALDADAIATNEVVLARGGTNASLTASNGAVVYSTASALALSAVGTVGQCLTSNGAAAPTWGACATLASHDLLSATHGDTSADAVTRGSLVYGNSSPAWDELVIGPSGSLLRSDGTDVAWSTNGTGLTALNASSLSSGTVPLARLSGITGTEISASAEIPVSAVQVAGGDWSEFNYGTTTWDPASILDGDEEATTVTVTGAAVGDICAAGLTTLDTEDLQLTAHVDSADTARVVLSNSTGGAIDITSGTLAVACLAF